MKNIISTFIREEDGAALVEYGLALLVVIMVGTAALIAVAQDTSTLFGRADIATGNAVTLGVSP